MKHKYFEILQTLMKIKVINIFLILLIFYTSAAISQTYIETGNEYHSRGMIDLDKGNIAKAETLFCYSAEEFSYAPSYYELAKIEFGKNTVYSRGKARDYIEKAIWKDPRNIEYKILKAKLLEVFSSSMAFDVYEEILDVDPDNTEALFNMGRISEERFYEYHNSFMSHESGPATSFNGYAYEFYYEADRLLRGAIKSDPARTDSYLQLSFLYAETAEYEKGIPLLTKVIQIDSLNKNAWLFLGYLYYKTLS
jgi:tetratricopeptide (TPR) repeat protein